MNGKLNTNSWNSQDFNNSEINGGAGSYRPLTLPKEMQDNSLINNSFGFGKFDSLKFNNSLFAMRSSNGNLIDPVVSKNKPNKLEKFMTNFEKNFDYINKNNEINDNKFELSPFGNVDNQSLNFNKKSFIFEENEQNKEKETGTDFNGGVHEYKEGNHSGKLNENKNNNSDRSHSNESEKPLRQKLKHPFLLEMLDFFVVFFTSDNLKDEEYQLSEIQEKILGAFVKRRFERIFLPEDFKDKKSEKVDFLISLINMPSNKRPEECYKFLLIRTIKSLKNRLAKTIGSKFSNDDYFYQYYFKEKADELRVEIKEFYYPFMKKAKKNAKLNAKYFDKLKLSGKFVADCQLYIEKCFYADHCREVRKKLTSLFKPYDNRLMRQTASVENIAEDLKSYILNNSHCKFPWTLKETEESITRFKNLIFE